MARRQEGIPCGRNCSFWKEMFTLQQAEKGDIYIYIKVRELASISKRHMIEAVQKLL